MSDRKLMQQALEALEQIAFAGMSGTGQESSEAITEWHARQAKRFISIAAHALDPLRARLAEPDDEPVAWMHTMDNTDGIEGNEPWSVLTFAAGNPFGIPGEDYSETYPVTSEPLYTRPAARKVQPLTDAECDRIIDAERWDTLAGRRAIVRRAHGITGDSHE